ncbi:UNVERIFIED_CONTAM: hypothetical protein GTU68_048177 [Idotea baltica]|nr:hypothetical protein [Idotea baltica]
MGYGDLSSFGNPTIKTPNLDRMAEEGQKWTQFYVADPVCTPSRAGLLTGLYPIRTGMTSKKRDYNVPLIENESEIERPVDQTTITKRYTDKSIDFIKENVNKPFFLYLAHSMPHIPLFTSEDFKGVSKRGTYGDVIEEIDYNVGRILQTVRDLNLDKNTIVLFTSDNGPWLSYKLHGGSAGPLRAGKGTTFEGGQRVPTIFWGPGQIEPGMVTELGSTLDIMTTFANLSGIPLAEKQKIDGFDLSNVLLNKKSSPRGEFFYWTRGELHAVRKGPWKLHIKQRKEVNYGKEREMDLPELYHLESDIGEKFNVAEAHPEIVAELQDLILKHLATTTNSRPDQLTARIPKEKNE